MQESGFYNEFLKEIEKLKAIKEVRKIFKEAAHVAAEECNEMKDLETDFNYVVQEWERDRVKRY